MATSPKKAAAPVIEPAPVVEAAPVVETAAPAPAALSVPAPLADVAKLFEAPAKSLTEFQDKVRGLVEKGLSETRANYAKAKSAADEATSALETSYASAKTGVAEINAKAIDALKANAEANFDFFKSILSAKTFSDVVTLNTEFARKQVEALTGQSKELSAIAQKVATETVEPIKAQVAKSFKVAG
jgi:phasin